MIERYYKETRAAGDSVQFGQPAASWAESGAAVGSHPKAHPAVTFDAIYDECRRTLAEVEAADFDVHFVIGEDGLLSACTTIHKRCVDECTQGVTVDAVRMGPR